MKVIFSFFILVSSSYAQAEQLEALRPASAQKQLQVIKNSLSGQSSGLKDPAVQISNVEGAQLIPESAARQLNEDLDPLGLFLKGQDSKSQKAGEAVQ